MQNFQPHKGLPMSCSEVQVVRQEEDFDMEYHIDTEAITSAVQFRHHKRGSGQPPSPDGTHLKTSEGFGADTGAG